MSSDASSAATRSYNGLQKYPQTRKIVLVRQSSSPTLASSCSAPRLSHKRPNVRPLGSSLLHLSSHLTLASPSHVPPPPRSPFQPTGPLRAQATRGQKTSGAIANAATARAPNHALAPLRPTAAPAPDRALPTPTTTGSATGRTKTRRRRRNTSPSPKSTRRTRRALPHTRPPETRRQSR